MTSNPEHPESSPAAAALSLLPEPSMELRVRPSEFARMLNVSKQTVSRWVKDGKVTLGPDGRLNPRVGAKQVLDNTDPDRLRANVLKPLMGDVGELRRRVAEQAAKLEVLEAELHEARASEASFMRLVDEIDALIREREADLRATASTEEWGDLLDSIYEQAEALAGSSADPEAAQS
jgi:hypothetical protein